MNHYRCVRKGVEELGIRPTADLEVDHPDHLFVLANGLVVSNSSKHSGGVAGAGHATSGFKFINQLTQVPKVFPGGATHAQKDGMVTDVKAAPQGGHYVAVAGVPHYVPAELSVTVRPGDRVEAGDVLSAGVPNPAEVTRHKGIGAGRRYFVKAFLDAYARSGMQAHRRNVELLATGLINHVRCTDEFGPYVEGDVARYSDVARGWEPRPGSASVAPPSAVGKYLEAPVLHHSIGTRVKPSMLDELARFGVDRVTVHPDPPPFEPVMVRGMGNLAHHPDWMTRHLGSGVGRSMVDAVHRGLESDTAGTSYVPAVADRANFGLHGLTAASDAPRDGDGDGKIRDGGKGEAPAPRPARRSLLHLF